MLFVGIAEGVDVGSRVAVNVKVGVNVGVNVGAKVDVKVAVAVETSLGEGNGSGEPVVATGVTTADTGAIARETWQPMTPSPNPISKKRNPMR